MPRAPKPVSWKRLESRAERIARSANDVQKVYVPEWVTFVIKASLTAAIGFVLMWVAPNWAFNTIQRANAYCSQPVPTEFFAACTSHECMHCDTVNGCVSGPYMLSSPAINEITSAQVEICGADHIYLRLWRRNTPSPPPPMVPEGDAEETTNDRLVTADSQIFQHFD